MLGARDSFVQAGESTCAAPPMEILFWHYQESIRYKRPLSPVRKAGTATVRAAVDLHQYHCTFAR